MLRCAQHDNVAGLGIVEREDSVLDFLGNLKRTHYCGELRAKDDGRDALVMGWVARRRDLGNLLFLDIRDRTGIVQVVFNKETQPAANAKAEQARSEFVVAVEGQIVKCFRDEDLRADRQPEFTQLDLEMSFPRQEDIFQVIEKVMVHACAVAGIKAEAPFPHMLYKDAIQKYGSDKPDLRFGMELHEVTNCFPAEAKEKLQIEGNVFAFAAPGAAGYSRKQLDELTEKAKSLHARGAYFAKVTAEGLTSTVEKLIGAENVKKLADACAAKPGDIVVAVSAKEQLKGTEASALIAGQLRSLLGEALGVIDKTQWKFLWLTGFPLFEWSESDKAWVSAQHPFTGIVDEDLEKLESAPWEVRSKGYDLVLNGYELGSGSIRIHRQDI